MKRDVLQFTQGEYDVLVIGGGINGAAVANAATFHGLKVALVEKDDFAAGTSSKSTKLIHGGLRYLAQGDWGLVREALRERAILLREAPHLVKPLAFVWPIYKADRRPFWVMKLGLTLYDWLGAQAMIEPHRSLTVDEVREAIPGIKTDGLLGGLQYWDAQMDDARLCLANIQQASKAGAHVANYAQVKGFLKENGKSVGARVYDRLTSQYVNIRARTIVCTAGPWTNRVLFLENKRLPPKIRMSKGVHLVVRGVMASRALILPMEQDKRVIFLIPWKGHTLIGTTDTDYRGHPDKASVEQEDVDYLLNAANQILPERTFQERDIVTTFVGLRPLLRQEGESSQVSRRHAISRSYSGLIYVVGGKYTTYRKVAQQCLEIILKKKLRDHQEHYPVYGGGALPEDLEQVARSYLLPSATVARLQGVYGDRAQEVMQLTRTEPSLKEKICNCSEVIGAQVVYALKVEMACTLEDVKRRCGLAGGDCAEHRCDQMIEKMVV